MKRFPRIFYGWWILASAFTATALGGATTSYGFSLFLVPLTREFGWSRLALSGAISLARLESGLIGPIEGLLVDRLGPRKMMLVGIPMAGIGFVLLAQIDWLSLVTRQDPLVVFYVVYVLLVALGNTIGTSLAASTAVANWFIRRRGMALGIFSSGHAIGAALWVPILGYLLQLFGWREALMLEGIAFLVIGIPAALVMRHRPEQYGLRPDGDPPSPPRPAQDPRDDNGPSLSHARQHRTPRGEELPPSPEEPGFTTRQALRTRAFWVLAISFALRVMVTNAVTVHLAALSQDLGMSSLQAAGMLSALAALSVVGRLGLPWLGDYFDKRRVYIGALVLMVAGLLVISFAREPWHVLLFLVCYSPAYGGLASLMALLRGDYFGRRAFATIAGTMAPLTTAGTITGPLLAGLVYDITGSYRLAMLFFATCGLANILLIQLLKRPQPGAENVPSGPVATTRSPERA